MFFLNLKYKPLSFVIGFNILTIIFFFTAPFDWDNKNFFLFFLLSFCTQLTLVLGYNLGFVMHKVELSKGVFLIRISRSNVNFFFLFYFFTFLLKYAYLLRFKPYQIIEMVGFLFIGLINPDVGYQLSLDSSRAFTIPWSVFFIISIINQIFFIVGFLSWSKLNKLKKVFFVLFFIIEIFYWVGRGTNFGVISLITTFVFCTFCKEKTSHAKKKSVRNKLIPVFLLLSALIFFSYNMNKRGGETEYDSKNFKINDVKVDEEHFVYLFMPNSLMPTYMYAVSYLSQGYYHTTLAFDLDYKPTYFFGFTPASLNMAEIAGGDLYNDTYVKRLENKGIDPDINWHSSYTWFASDVTFFGIPFLFFGIGFLFGFLWNLILFQDDFLSKIIFVIIGNFLFFMFANNNYLSSVFYSFMIIMPIWIFTRIKKVKLN